MPLGGDVRVCIAYSEDGAAEDDGGVNVADSQHTDGTEARITLMYQHSC